MTEESTSVQEKLTKVRELQRRALAGDERAAREAVELALGPSLPKVPAEEVEQLVRELMDPSTASTPAGSVRSAAKQLPKKELPPATPSEPAEPRPFEQVEFRCEWCRDLQMVTRTKDVKDPRFGRPVPCPKCVPVQAVLAHYGIPEVHQAMTLEAMERLPGKVAALDFVSTWDCRTSVVLHSADGALDSTWGTGKTQLAVLLVRRALEVGIAPYFTTSIDLLERIKATFDDRSDEQTKMVVALLSAEPLLVLDDLGKENQTPWAMAQLFQVLDRRWSSGRTTIITTNMTGPAEMAARVGGAITDRFRDAIWIAVGGPSMRGQLRIVR